MGKDKKELSAIEQMKLNHAEQLKGVTDKVAIEALKKNQAEQLKQMAGRNKKEEKQSGQDENKKEETVNDTTDVADKG